MPGGPVEANQSLSLILQVAERQNASVVYDNVESIDIDASTEQSEFRRELRKFIEPIRHAGSRNEYRTPTKSSLGRFRAGTCDRLASHRMLHRIQAGS